MSIHIEGASEHNLKNVDVEIGDGLTVVTGVSGSGKTSLVFDTLYHEARRRFLEIFSLGERLAPADVRVITGVGPAVAVGQNLLNRNPGSTLVTASGLHPFLRLLYTNFGERRCAACGADLAVYTEDEIVERVLTLLQKGEVTLLAPLFRGARGSHRTLLALLAETFGAEALRLDGHRPEPSMLSALDPAAPHSLAVVVGSLSPDAGAQRERVRRERVRRVRVQRVREAVGRAWALGATAVVLELSKGDENEAETFSVTLSRAPVCAACGAWFGDLAPVLFHRACPYCEGEGCDRCDGTGLHPEATAVRWQGLRLPDLLALPVSEVRRRFGAAALPTTAARLVTEIQRRLDALDRVGLGYVALDRPLPTLSRGESQRVRLAVALTSRLEDMLHVLDEPTIGQHPADVARLLPAFRELRGPVVFVEHDRIAAAAADQALDLGPGAGPKGGRVTFSGAPEALWDADTPTGRYFSLRERVTIPEARPAPETFLTVRGACLRNLRGVDVPIPLGRLTVVTGVSGSGKSTFVEDVLAVSLAEGTPQGCADLDGPALNVVMVDQSPIGRNPRSNPATYTKLATIIRDTFSEATGLSTSHFSFNRPEGACPACKGIGAVEVKMRYLPSTWIPCAECEGRRFSDEVLAAAVDFGDETLSIADVYQLTINEVAPLLAKSEHLSKKQQRSARRILRALRDIGLGYLALGQPSPTLSGGEAQRVKLAKFLGRRGLARQLLILDEPSTGLHPRDVSGLLKVLDRLVRHGATAVVVEHNTDIIRAADWVVDLGPGSGPEGGDLIYAGPFNGLAEVTDSITAQALAKESAIVPARELRGTPDAHVPSGEILIQGATANNLKHVDVRIPKGQLTVVTGVSGSGKSSLVGDVLESEARRRFLETLSMYERQGTREGPEAEVVNVSGLGVAITVGGGGRGAFGRRNTVGAATEIAHHLAVLFSWLGARDCPQCGTPMVRVGAGRHTARRRRSGTWQCPSCDATFPIAAPRHFSPSVYAAACTTCHGVGTLREPNPDKLIIHPEKPLCDGAMYSPGFFPKGYLCKPMNGGYELVQALAKVFEFDPATTPWNAMKPEAQHAFLHGYPEKLEVIHESRNGTTSTRWHRYPGFYGWIRDWDTGGTYTDTRVCPDCGGARLRAEYAAVTLAGQTFHAISEMDLARLSGVITTVDAGALETGADNPAAATVATSLATVQQRLHFLCQVGLGYLHLNRDAATLSAGEAQRVKLAGLLGSGLTSLTVLMDEPTRGMHPSEVAALTGALKVLRDEGNTVVVVEHDPGLIRAADYLIDMGPGAGSSGGEVVAAGTPAEVAQTETLTAQWLRDERRCGERQRGEQRERRAAQGWITILGARAHNLRGETVRLPKGTLVGVCGVSGSGKSTLLIDTVGRALVPKKHTTSVASMPIDPGEHDVIEGAPARTILVDQSKSGVHSPAHFLGLAKQVHKLYAQSEDAQVLGLNEKVLGQRCSVCGGSGTTTLDMGFLPNVHATCETCQGTGYGPEAWQVRLHGVALPDCFGLTLDEVYDRFGAESSTLAAKLATARDVGLGYLVLRQPGYALSGGEAQRLKIAHELYRRSRSKTLYILDEPTVGQHLEDVARLTAVLHRLVDQGHTVVVVEHHTHLLAACDWLVELGPGGGPDGGHVIAAGTPEAVAAGTPEAVAAGETPTAAYLREVLYG